MLGLASGEHLGQRQVYNGVRLVFMVYTTVQREIYLVHYTRYCVHCTENELPKLYDLMASSSRSI